MDTFYQAIVIFIAGYLYLRLTGKKAVAQMHTFDLLYILILTNIISTPLEDNKVGKALIYAGIIVVLYKIFVRLALHNKLRWILYESPTVLIRNGDIDRNGLKKARMPMNELLSHLRVQGYTDTQNIAIALMEGTGSISVIPKADYRPVQPKDISLKVKQEYIPIPLVMDGQILDHNLKYLQLERAWLINEVKKMGRDVDKIMLATFLDNRQLFIDDNEIKEHKGNPYFYKPGEDN